MQIKNKEWLELNEKGTTLYGYDQDWFSTPYKMTRGCGPTVAAMILVYLARRDSLWLPFKGESISEAFLSMERAWEYFTPHPALGLYSTEKFCLGAARLILDYGLNLKVRKLSVRLLKSWRPRTKKTAAFIKRGLESDSPVAFLNLQSGSCKQLESWHWALIVGMEKDNGKDIVVLYDNGGIRRFDLEEWLETSGLGGGFVYFDKTRAL